MCYKCIRTGMPKLEISGIQGHIVGYTIGKAKRKGGRALRGYLGPPMRSKNESCSSQVSSY